MKDPNRKIIAAKIGKNKKFDVDNANVEIKFLKQLKGGFPGDDEGRDQIV